MPKNIVILSDGTGNIGGYYTNVYKLYRMLEDRTENQVVFYDGGMGTDWRKVNANAFGAGFSKNLLNCYRFIFENYTVGDKLFMLGFSRGAALVGNLAGFIHYFGILSKSDTSLIRQAFILYAQYKRNTNIATKAFRGDFNEITSRFTDAHPTMGVEIEFLGVWDTVPAIGVVALAGFTSFLGGLLRYDYRNFELHSSVKNAYQALSIDDDREWFHPMIWNVKGKIKQVWFSGAHTDVGGGFTEAGLSDITLEWMIKSAESHGLRLNRGSRKYWNFCVAPDATDILHPPRAGIGRIYAAASREKVWDSKAIETFGPPVIHESVLIRAEQDANYRPWILKKYGDYPEPEKWLLESRDKFLQSRYDEDLKNRYREYCMDIGISGERKLPTFEAWLVDHPSPYDEWFKRNQIIEQEWLWKNDAVVQEFKGRKYLVERDEKTIWRDYDKNSLQEKLNLISLDESAYDNLWKRGMAKKRIEHDRNRWMK